MAGTTLRAPAADLDSAAEVLAAARERRAAALEAERDVFVLAVQWAAMHSVDSLQDAAMW
jgi:hypothetical protein